MRGNVVDMAVGIIIGGAFGKIVSSVVADIIMPPVGLLIGGVNFSDLKITLKEAVVEGGAEVTPAVTLNYGNFIQTTLDFIIIALAISPFGKRNERPQQKEERGTESSGCPSGRHPTAHGNQGLTEKEK